jgi:hypothetical protein
MERVRAYTSIGAVAGVVDGALARVSLYGMYTGEAGNFVLDVKDTDPRYIYTTKEGWIDLRHVTSAAGVNTGPAVLLLGPGAADIGGIALEGIQQAFPKTRASGFKWEDIVSNSLGGQAGLISMASFSTASPGEVAASLIRIRGPLDQQAAQDHLCQPVK